MEYLCFVELYENLAATSKRLEKTALISYFLRDLYKEGKSEWIYLLRGKVVPDYDSRELGISTQLIIKTLNSAFGIPYHQVVTDFNSKGDLGLLAEHYAEQRTQRTLFSKTLQVKNVFDNLYQLLNIVGKGTVDKKIALVSELLTSASGKEAKYIVRTVLSDLRVGVADAVLIDALAQAFFESDEDAKLLLEEKYHLANDFALLFDSASKGKNALKRIDLSPGRPMAVMLAVKAENMEEAFRICGKPAAVEYKYDGFRMLINKSSAGISLFTRRLENVTLQFPDVVEAVEKHVRTKEFILDAEIVGYDSRTKAYLPFEAISQRIKRKYDIAQLIEKLPVEINVFDILYLDGKNLLSVPFSERREILEKLILSQSFLIRPAIQRIVSTIEEAEEFYQEALKKGEEGIMMKKLDAPYRQGRKVGYLVKLKPIIQDLDLVIVGAEYGTGKRGGWLTSYIVACKAGNSFLEIGKVSSGLKEKEEEGTTYDEITKLLKPLILSTSGNEVRVSPKTIVSVTYQNIQPSPSYSSGYALRFPRITHYRPDKKIEEIATLEEIKKEVKKQR
mgnify:CR=1 FL=1